MISVRAEYSGIVISLIDAFSYSPAGCIRKGPAPVSLFYPCLALIHSSFFSSSNSKFPYMISMKWKESLSCDAFRDTLSVTHCAYDDHVQLIVHIANLYIFQLYFPRPGGNKRNYEKGHAWINIGHGMITGSSTVYFSMFINEIRHYLN